MRQSRHPRKKPRQNRSKATVDALVEAATRIFATTDFAHATTNSIAKMAGVSIGSLYQYFPSKLALLEAVHERHIIGLWSVAGVACDNAQALPWPDALAHFVAATNEYNVKSGRLFGLFQRELPGSIPSGLHIDSAKSAYEAKLRALLLAHKSNVQVDLDRAVQMIPIIGKGVAIATFHSYPESLQNGQMVAEVTKVLNNYLSTPEPANAKQAKIDTGKNSLVGSTGGP